MSAPLAPGFLIASPPLGDPNFERTVVLLAIHGPRGALGFVVNRVAPLKLGEVMSLAGYGERAGAASGVVYLGGPVEPGSGWILSNDSALIATPPPADASAPGTDNDSVIDVTESVKISSSRSAFDALARDLELPDPDAAAAAALKQRLVFLGYSGWGPGQLEGEIAQGAWLPAPFDSGVVFDVDVTKRWEAAYALLGVSPAMSIGMRTVGEA
ncbi:MAG: YqgE/AlgH family protein [Polyangiaceae bacterium]|nr:YqgE/AlgH family protein [Polyangiaceae bacterium]